MRSHHAKNTLRITSEQTIGTLDDCVIGQNLMRDISFGSTKGGV
jgi:hypothetical protein